MLPVGLLMKEHRLIERMIGLMKKEVEHIEKLNDANMPLIETAIDFIRTYADRCHHGKEEDILFRELKKKQIFPEHKNIMEQLIQEHVWGRETVRQLVAAKDQYILENKEALDEIVKLMKNLVDFYPKHIEKEDKHFFLPCMEYFNGREKEAMLQECFDFDKELIHEKYRKIVEDFEQE